MKAFSLNTLYKKGLFWCIVVVAPLGLLLYHVRALNAPPRDPFFRQRVYFDRVHNFVDQLSPALGDNYDEARLRKRLGRLQKRHSVKTFFILGQDGEILFHEKDPAVSDKLKLSTVDLEPIKEFLSWKQAPENGLSVIHPYNPRGARRAFVAAEVSLGEQPGYLYIVFGRTRRGVSASPNIIIPWYYDWIVVIGSIMIVQGIIIVLIFVHPVRNILNVVEKIAQGNLSERTVVKGSDELAQLGAKINSMADTIESMLAELKRTDALQREMVSALSHDFGTPLFSAQAYLTKLKNTDDTLSDEQKKEFLDIAVRNLEKLRELVQAFFELSKLDLRDVTPTLEPFSLLDIVTEELLPKLQALADQSQITLRAEYDLNLPRVSADVALIERVLTNLITNAIRYNRPEGEVLIKLQEKKDRVQVQVSDTGIGISEQDLPHVFDRFFRSDKSRSGISGGSGLGLAIVKKILEAHDEEISVSSSFGEGTVFTFSLKSIPLQESSHNNV